MASNLPPARKEILKTNALALRSTTPAPPFLLPLPRPEGAEDRDGKLRTVKDVFETQLALDRFGFSPGPIDGQPGSQTRMALKAFQASRRIPQTGIVDAETRRVLLVSDPTTRSYVVTASDVAKLRTTGRTWTAKSKQDRLEYETVLEMLSEQGHAKPDLLRRLNPEIDWSRVSVGWVVRVPHVEPIPASAKSASIHIRLSDKSLEVKDQAGNTLLHYPCSIAKLVEKRPLGNLRVISKASNPNYKFTPSLFPESPEHRNGAAPMMIPSGPNNPVGTGWVGLDKPGYGIHGTPNPEAVGRTESHGCFRLANWNIERLLPLVWIGMPVIVDP